MWGIIEATCRGAATRRAPHAGEELVPGKLLTVRGPIDAEEAGFTLPHEHVMVDFIGAAQTGPDRYDRDEADRVMRPYLEEAMACGVKTLVECTPMYLARDVRLLARLSEESGLNILTNTGQYMEPFLPERTFGLAAEELAREWIAECAAGIDGTDVRPGFIKTAVRSEPLAPMQVKIIRAAALTSRETGLAIATHTGYADQAEEVLGLLEREGIPPGRWIFVHAQAEPEPRRLITIARRGAWIELDGLSAESAEKHRLALMMLLEAGCADRVLLSHDSGWYHVGEPGGGEIRGYAYLPSAFLPALRKRGVDAETLRRICEVNPARAFGIGS